MRVVFWLLGTSAILRISYRHDDSIGLFFQSHLLARHLGGRYPGQAIFIGFFGRMSAKTIIVVKQKVTKYAKRQNKLLQ